MDPKTATKLEEVELLKLQNATLRLAIVTKEREDLARALFAKYGSPGEQLSFNDDGSIVRPTPGDAAPK